MEWRATGDDLSQLQVVDYDVLIRDLKKFVIAETEACFEVKFKSLLFTIMYW